VKRPVAAILLGMFVLAQAWWVWGHGRGAQNAIGPAQEGWRLLLAGRARVSVATDGDLVMATGPRRYFLTQGDGRIRRLSLTEVPQVLPGAQLVKVQLAPVAGKLRLVGVQGVPAWVSPNGVAAAVYDPRDRSLWALLADDPRPRPLGPEDPHDPGALVWSQGGGKLAYLSGRPAELWLWQVGHYAQDLGRAPGVPVAVRGDGSLVVALPNGAPGMVLPGVAGVVPAAESPVVSSSPDGGYVLVGHGGRLWLLNLGTGLAAPLPLGRAAVQDVAWGPQGQVAVETVAGDLWWVDGSTHRAIRLTLPAGARLAPHGLVTVWRGRLVAVLDTSRGPMTYLYTPAMQV
jgi:hypothetical protein